MAPESVGAQADPKSTNPPAGARRNLWRNRLILIVALFAAMTAGMYFGNPLGTATRDPRGRILGFVAYTIQTKAMLPTLSVGDEVVVSTATCRFGSLEAGDLVVFLVPGKGHATVLRVIALPGQTVSLRGGRVYVDGIALDEPYLNADFVRSPYSHTLAESEVPVREYFLLGDNRDAAGDSRVFGTVTHEALIGKVMWP